MAGKASRSVRRALAAALLLLPLAAPVAALEVPDPDEVALGTVESVQNVSLEDRRRVAAEDCLKAVFDRHFEALLDVHSADELVVRLDSGAEVRFTYYGLVRFRPGQRVRVFAGPAGTRVEVA